MRKRFWKTCGLVLLNFFCVIIMAILMFSVGMEFYYFSLAAMAFEWILAIKHFVLLVLFSYFLLAFEKKTMRCKEIM